jgi:hypothetical protein
MSQSSKQAQKIDPYLSQDTYDNCDAAFFFNRSVLCFSPSFERDDIRASPSGGT